MIAYCYRTGQIEFGKKTPGGALLIASGPARKLKEAVGVMARWSYPSKRGGNDSVPLVPGIPEADDDQAALAALRLFSEEIRKRLVPSLCVHRASVRNPS